MPRSPLRLPKTFVIQDDLSELPAIRVIRDAVYSLHYDRHREAELVARDNGCRLSRVFRKLDKNHSHTVSLEEFKSALTFLRVTCSDDMAAQIFGFFDEDNTGDMDYNEFVHHVSPLAFLYRNKVRLSGDLTAEEALQIIVEEMNTQSHGRSVRRIYDTYDRLRRGVMDHEGFLFCISKLGFTCGGNLSDRIFAHLDADGNGSISFEEFSGAIAGRLQAVRTERLLDEKKQLAEIFEDEKFPAVVVKDTETVKYALKKIKNTIYNPVLPGSLSTLKNRMNAVFRLYDTNNDGELDIEEFTLAIRALNITISDHMLKKIFFVEGDVDGSCTLDIDECVRLMSPRPALVHKPTHIRDDCKIKQALHLMYDHIHHLNFGKSLERFFLAHDANKDGSLSIDEFRAALKKTDLDVSLTKARELFDAIDADHNGSLSVQEFVSGAYYRYDKAKADADRLKRTGWTPAASKRKKATRQSSPGPIAEGQESPQKKFKASANLVSM